MTLIDGDRLNDSIQTELCADLKCDSCSMRTENGGCRVEEWIEHKERTIVRNNNFIDFFPTEYECSNCGLRRATYFINSPLSNYCPNCGADMREREGE